MCKFLSRSERGLSIYKLSIKHVMFDLSAKEILPYVLQVVYYLQELDGDDDLFSISTVNGKGVLRLAGHLDYERKFLYQIRVLAVDRAINERVSDYFFIMS